MDKIEIKKTSATRLVTKLKRFVEKLWLNRNPAGIELGAIIEEFEEDILAEEIYHDKFRASELQKIKNIKDGYKLEINDLFEQVSTFKENMRQKEALIANFKKQMDLKDDARAELETKIAKLNLDFSSKEFELYDKISQKQKEFMDKWVKKNEELGVKTEAMKKEYDKKFKNLTEKEGAFKTSFDIEKEKLNSKMKTVIENYKDRIGSLEAKEKLLKDDFNAQKKTLIRTFERVKIDFEEREKKLKERENRQ